MKKLRSFLNARELPINMQSLYRKGTVFVMEQNCIFVVI